MSVFGGDSWAREAQQRKRRVEDVVVDGLDASSYKKLSNGKFACLLCPHSPILDSLLMLSMHCKGARHRAAESRLKEKELARQNEMNKRIALSDSSGGTAKSRTCNQKFESGGKPLIEQVLKAASEIFTHRDSPQELKSRDLESNWLDSSIWITGNVEKENLNLLLQDGSVIVMGNGTKMKMLSLTLMKKIQIFVLVDNSDNDNTGRLFYFNNLTSKLSALLNNFYQRLGVLIKLHKMVLFTALSKFLMGHN